MTAPHHIERGAGPAVVFLHGIGGDGASWLMELEALAGHWRAIAWDMPGYGASPALPEMTFPALADALDALLDSLDIDRAHLIGHSIGGMVAQEFAATFPHRVASLVLYATSPAFGRPDGDWQREFLAARLAPLDAGRRMADLAPSIVAGLVGGEPDPDGVARATAAMARVPEDAYRAAMRCLVTFDRREALPEIAVPVLVLAGAEDDNAPARMMERMASRIPGADFQLIAGAGHLAHFERPAAFRAAIVSFLDGVTARREREAAR
ncbi:MAG: alpha/beta fold hydrolase [Rhodospirillales bacterium]|nr:MAG: alpha/beta fold hydrolase [Rhodospirillales bacterium]